MNTGQIVFAQLMEHVPLFVPAHRRSLQRRTANAGIFVLGSVCVYGLRSTNISGELARSGSLPAVASGATLSHGDLRSGEPQHAGRCQRVARLAYLRRHRRRVDPPGTNALCERQFCRGTRLDRRCAGRQPIDLCLSLFAWARFRSTKAIKMNTVKRRGTQPPVIKKFQQSYSGGQSQPITNANLFSLFIRTHQHMGFTFISVH